MPPTIKTRRELLIELRDQVAARLISQEASMLYWRALSKTAKRDSQEKVDAIQKVALNKQLISQDKKYLEIIDGMMKGQSGSS